MAAPDQSTIIPAATGGSPQRDDNDATSSPPIGLVGPSINRTPPPFSRQCDMDVVCGGTWISDTGSRHTDSFSDNVRADARRAACVRHRSLHEACLKSTTSARVVEIVAGLDVDGLKRFLAGGEGGEPATLVCTCEGSIGGL